MTIPVCINDNSQGSRVDSFTREQLGLIVERFNDRLSNIDVHVGNGPANHGNVDPTCAIDARLNPRGTLHVRASEPDVYMAIRKAVQRLEAAISRAVDLAADEQPPTAEEGSAIASPREPSISHQRRGGEHQT